MKETAMHPVKRTHSLEEERQVLLAEIQSSRAVYRRMLAEADAPRPGPFSRARRSHAGGASGSGRAEDAKQWARDHPAMVVAGLAGTIALALLARRRTKRHKSAAATMKQAEQSSGQSLLKEQSPLPRVAGGVLATAFASLATGLLRNPAQLRFAARAMPALLDYVRRWRSNVNARSAQVAGEVRNAGSTARSAMRDAGSRS